MPPLPLVVGKIVTESTRSTNIRNVSEKDEKDLVKETELGGIEVGGPDLPRMQTLEKLKGRSWILLLSKVSKTINVVSCNIRIVVGYSFLVIN